MNDSMLNPSPNTPRRPANWLLAALLALFVAACGGGPVVCGPAELVMPDNSAPVAGSIINELDPLFVWSYSGCEPDGWQAQVTTYGGYDFGVTQTGNPLPAQTSWVFADDLQPATQYEWHVAAINDGTMGPYSTSTMFWTGPVCATALLEAPVQNTPANHSTVNTEFPPHGWSLQDGCIPTWVTLNVNEFPDFSGPNLVATTAGTSPHIGQIPMGALDNCTRYYWRVRGENADGAGPWSPTWTYRTDFAGDCAPPPICDTAALSAPLLSYPGFFEIVDELIPTLSWHYNDTCTPEGYRIDIGLYQGAYAEATTISGGTGNPSTLWAPAEALQPATRYEWRVAGINGTTLGPYSASIPFWTGPVCATALMPAPAQTEPADGSVVNTLTPVLRWTYPGGCIPQGTTMELDTDPSFPGPNLGASFAFPHSGQVPEELDNCTEYFWRVRGDNSDGSGPFSPTWSFFVNLDGSCAGMDSEEGVMGRATRDLNCRAGDATAFVETGFFGLNDTASVVGKNQAETWLLVNKRLGGGNCWVSAPYVELLNNASLAGVPIVASPPLPATSTPFQVTSVVASVSPPTFQGTCPYTFNFTAAITTNGAGTVEYQWRRDDLSAPVKQSLVFASAGTQNVQTTWSLGAPDKNYTLWERVEILSPNALISNQATFSLYCNK